MVYSAVIMADCAKNNVTFTVQFYDPSALERQIKVCQSMAESDCSDHLHTAVGPRKLVNTEFKYYDAAFTTPHCMLDINLL